MCDKLTPELLDIIYSKTNSTLTHDRHNDDKDFLIVQDWDEAGIIQREINKILKLEAYHKWKKIYETQYGDRAFQDMRFGEGKSGEPVNVSDGKPPYKIPNGLIELDDLVDWGFADEYTTCHNCDGLIRMTADSYSWQPDYHIFKNGELLCDLCISERAIDEYIEEHVNQPMLLNLKIVNITHYGWKKCDHIFETGMFPGQTDIPRDIIKREKDRGRDVIFTGDVSQFDIRFNVWFREKEYDQNESNKR